MADLNKHQNIEKMKIVTVVIACLLLLGCKNEEPRSTETPGPQESAETPGLLSTQPEPVKFTLDHANALADLPLACINVQYPNKLNQTLATAEEVKEPKELHPAFYGCFDWHS